MRNKERANKDMGQNQFMSMMKKLIKEEEKVLVIDPKAEYESY